MSSDTYSIQQRTDVYRDIVLDYAEGDRRLAVELALTPGLFAKIRYMGLGGDFECWTEPVGVEIPRGHRATIQGRVLAWAKAHRLSIGFGPGFSRAEDAEHERVWRARSQPRTLFGFIRLFLFG